MSTNMMSAAALSLALGLAGCPHAGQSDHPRAMPPQSDPAVCNAASPSAGDGCTVQQRVCLLVNELPAGLQHPDFVPEAKYSQSWQPHVQRWSANLALLSADPALGGPSLELSSMVDLIGKGAKERREISASPALAIGLVRSLAEAAERSVAPTKLGCPIPAAAPSPAS